MAPRLRTPTAPRLRTPKAEASNGTKFEDSHGSKAEGFPGTNAEDSNGTKAVDSNGTKAEDSNGTKAADSKGTKAEDSNGTKVENSNGTNAKDSSGVAAPVKKNKEHNFDQGQAAVRMDADYLRALIQAKKDKLRPVGSQSENLSELGDYMICRWDSGYMILQTGTEEPSIEPIGWHCRS